MQLPDELWLTAQFFLSLLALLALPHQPDRSETYFNPAFG